MVHAKFKKVSCSGLVATTGDWRRCTERGNEASEGWERTRFGWYCPKHAEMQRSAERRRGRGA